MSPSSRPTHTQALSLFSDDRRIRENDADYQPDKDTLLIMTSAGGGGSTGEQQTRIRTDRAAPERPLHFAEAECGLTSAEFIMQ